MASVPETGFLILADLSGYTAYLSRGELEHAPAIAGDLLETIVGRLDPPFRLAKLEGDAAFLFAEDGRADGSLLVDALEASYLAFRRRLRSIDQASACECNSCRLAPRLDLKLFVHHGSYVRTSIAGREELAGTDVIVAHRLLKGTAAANAGGSGFAQITEAAVVALGLDPVADGFQPADEEIHQLGLVRAFSLDLEARWQSENAARRLDVTADEAIIDLSAVLAADSATAWAHLTSPALRTRWEGPIEITETSPGGLRGIGTTSECVTGTARDPGGDRRLAAVRARRVAARRPGAGSRGGDRRPRARRGNRTDVRVRWRYAGEGEPDAGAVERLRVERADAIGRLERLLARGLTIA